MVNSPELQVKVDKLVKALGDDLIKDMQTDVNRMKKMGQYAQYIEQRKMGLLMGQPGEIIDLLLTVGVLK